MARYTGPKNKLARKIGEDLGLKSNSLKVAKRLSIFPGQHGIKGRRKVSDYGKQLKEKQKVKYIYGILEKYLRRQYDQAVVEETATGSTMLTLLERRLDNVVYRLGWALTRAAARQLVTHNHILVNNKKMNIASYQVHTDDVITVREGSMRSHLLAERVKEAVPNVTWLESKAQIAKVSRLPQREDVLENIEEQLIVEYYSR
jgi:small subunit ribosomal protein S4